MLNLKDANMNFGESLCGAYIVRRKKKEKR